MGARFSRFWRQWERYGIDQWVVTVMRDGYQIPFVGEILPPLTRVPRSFPSYSGNREKHAVLEKEVRDMLEKEAIEEVQPIDRAFYNRLFLVPKASGKWRPVLDVSRLNKYVSTTKFSMETSQTVLDSIRQGDWMMTVDMQDAYFHVPIHPRSRRFLRFTFEGKVYQFRAMCFGLSTAPQVFTRVLAPLAKIVHLAGFRIILYLDDWLILAESVEEILKARKFILTLTQELGIIINVEKSLLVPCQSLTYLGMRIDTIRFWVSPTEKRIDRALSLLGEFLSSESRSARCWQSLLGFMSSLERFVPGARLRMRRVQHFFRRAWRKDWQNQDILIQIPQDLKTLLKWWTDKDRLARGVSLQAKEPDLFLFSDASRANWGAKVGTVHLTGTWSKEEQKEHINKLELRAIFNALKESEELVRGKVVAVFADNTTALSYIKKQGGTRSWDLFHLVEELLFWTEERDILLKPKFVQGKTNVVADCLSRKDQVVPTEWVLHPEVCRLLWRLWGQPLVDMFATSLTKRLTNYFSPHLDEQAVGIDAFLQSWNDLDGYAFPPFALIRRVLNKIKRARNCRITLVAPWWPQREWFPDLIDLLIDHPRELPQRRDLLLQVTNRALHGNLPGLRLVGWRLCSDLGERRAYQIKCPKGCSGLEPIPLTACIS